MTRVLAIFCNPRNTDALRLQSEQRVLQQSLRSTSATLEVVPAATIDDLRAALLNRQFDVIHFSGHGCVDGPLLSLVKHKLSAAAIQLPDSSPAAMMNLCYAPAVAALKRWLEQNHVSSPSSSSSSSSSTAPDDAPLCTLLFKLSEEANRPAVAWVEGASSTGTRLDANGVHRVMLRDADLVKHRVGALAFEGPTGALEPPKPDVLARLLIVSLAPSHGVVFLNACDTYIQAHWLQQHGASHVIYAGSRISDAAASEFSRGFYEALAFGCATPEAYEQGKLAVELRYDTVQHGCPSLLQQPGVGEAGGGSSLSSSTGAASLPPSLAGGMIAPPTSNSPPDSGLMGPTTPMTSGVASAAPPVDDTVLHPVLEEFFGEAVATSAPSLQELVPMPGHHQVTVCEPLLRLVRDGLGRLHSLGFNQKASRAVEDAIPIEQLAAAPLTAAAFRQSHKLLGTALKLRWGVLHTLGGGQFERARVELLRALKMIQMVGELAGTSTDAAAAAAAAAGTSPATTTAEATTIEAAGSAAPPVATAVYVYPQLQVALGEADTCLSLAVVQLHLRDAPRASEHARLALERYRQIGASTQAALAQLTLSECAQLAGDPSAAEEELRGSLRAFRAVHCALGEAEALRMLGSLRLDMGDDISGRPLLRDALAKYDTLEEHDAFSPFGVASALRLLGSDEDGAHQGGARAARDAADAVDGGGVELPEQHSAWLLGTGASSSTRAGGGKASATRAAQYRKGSTAAKVGGRFNRAFRSGRPCGAVGESGEMAAARRTANGRPRAPARRCLLFKCSCLRLHLVLAAGGPADEEDEEDEEEV